MIATHLDSYKLPIGSGEHEHFSYAGLLAIDRSTRHLVMVTRQRQYARLHAPDARGLLALDGPFHPLWPSEAPPPPESSPAGLLVDGERIISTASIFYDSGNTQTYGHFLNGRWHTLVAPNMQGYVAGYMCWVPDRWRAVLGDLLTGQCGVPIIHRTSYGPCAFAVGLDGLWTQPLVYYTAEHPTLGPYDGREADTDFNDTMQIKGCAIVGDTLVFVGTIGIGPRCYGIGIDDPSLPAEGETRGGEHFCHDTELSDKGGHAFPYRYQLWTYRLHDVLAAAHPWDIVPTIVPLSGFAPGPTRLAGAAYDDASGVLYVSQYMAENNDRVAGYPIVHLFGLSEVDAPAPVPAPTPTPAPITLQSLADRVDGLQVVTTALATKLAAVKAALD